MGMADLIDFEDGPALAPLLEGARARGVADALEMAGQAAILLSGAGEVLHAGESAKPLLGAGLRLAEGRLELKDARAKGFDGLLAVALDGEGPPHGDGIILPAPDGGAIRMRILPFHGGKKNPAQLLKAIVLLERLNPPSANMVDKP